MMTSMPFSKCSEADLKIFMPDFLQSGFFIVKMHKKPGENSVYTDVEIK